MSLKQIQDQIIFANLKYPAGFDKVVSGMFSSYFFQIIFQLIAEYLMKPAGIINIMLFINILINGCGVNVKIISHERGMQDGLRFCTLRELPALIFRN